MTMAPPAVRGASQYVKSILYPRRELSEAQISDMRQQAYRAAIKTASEALGLGESQLAVREGLPNTDFALTNEIWTAAAFLANAWNVYINNAMGNTKIAVFYGFAFVGTNMQVSALQYSVGSSGGSGRKLLMSIERMIAEDMLVAYHPPVIYKNNDLVYLQLYSRAAVIQQFAPLVYIAEPKNNNLGAADILA